MSNVKPFYYRAWFKSDSSYIKNDHAKRVNGENHGFLFLQR